MTHRTAPLPARLTHLRAADAAGGAVAAQCLLLTVVALTLSAQPHPAIWLTGQFLLAFALVQWFAVLHECGHETLFRTRLLHAPLGQVAAFFSLIPFYNWKRVHGRHHKWTGWQDIDPTTASLVPRELSRAERLLVNVCWHYWIPLFSVIYRVNNFWNWPRLKTLFTKPHDRRLLAGNIVALAASYALLIALAGIGTALRVGGLALVLALVAEDLLL